MGAILASSYDGQAVEQHQIRWQQDLTGAQRAAVSGEIEKSRFIPEFAYVDPGTIYVDESYQRPLSLDRVWEIATTFTWALYDPLWIGKRKDDKLYVVDGRHRLTAALILGPERVDSVPCQIRRTAGVEEEAQIFVALQEKRRRITSAQRFAAKLVFKDPIAMDLQRILTQNGFKIVSEGFGGNAFRSAPNEITAVATLESIYRSGGKQRVSAVLQIIREAWDGEAPTTSAYMLRAVNHTIEREPTLKPEMIARRLAEKDPWGIIERGMRHSHANGIPTSDAMTDVLLKVVNE